MKTQNITNGIFVIREIKSLTPTAKNELKKKKDINVTIFTENELAFNITKHFLVPFHELLSEEEKQLILKDNMVTPEQLPKIYVTDPVSKYYGFKENQVIRIHRDTSETAGKYKHYRLVIPDPDKN